MSAPNIPAPADVDIFGEISAVKATIGQLDVAQLAVGGTTTLGAVTLQGNVTGPIYLDGAANTGVLTTPGAKQLVISSNGQITAGAGSSASVQILGNAMYLNDGSDATANITLVSNNTTVSSPIYLQDQTFVEDNLVLSGASSTGVMTTTVGQQLVIAANAKTTAGAGSSASILINGNSILLNDGQDATGNILIGGNNTEVLTPLICKDQVFVDNTLTLSGTSTYKGVLTSGVGKQTVIAADGGTGEGLAASGNIQINGNVVRIYDGLSAVAAFACENQRFNVLSYMSVSGMLSLPAFGYACINGGQTDSPLTGTWAWDCTVSSAFATWSSQSITLIGSSSAAAGFTVLNEGFYKISAGANGSAGAVFAIRFNGANSIYSNPSAAGTLGVASGVVHLAANTAVTVATIGASDHSRLGSNLVIERMNGQFSSTFTQAGTDTVFGDM